jgi:hypothetical protein
VSYQPDSWARGALRALGLVLGVAIVSRVAVELMAPVLPVALGLAGLLIVHLLIFRRR